MACVTGPNEGRQISARAFALPRWALLTARERSAVLQILWAAGRDARTRARCPASDGIAGAAADGG